MSGDPSFPSGEVVVNTQLGAYRVEERLGAGGMGAGYRATDTELGRSVALKVIRAESMHNAGLARFEREARVLASLNHPHIAGIHGMEQSGRTQFLVLEYVPGPTLADHLERGPLPMQETLLAGKQIAEALEAVHAKSIIHRDLKPANIKISPEGKVKVLDFGLAKSIRHSLGVASDGAGQKWFYCYRYFLTVTKSPWKTWERVRRMNRVVKRPARKSSLLFRQIADQAVYRDFGHDVT
jgi:serine/threonine protein kinase